MKPTPSISPATTEPELLKYLYPFSSVKPSQPFPCFQLTHSQKKSLQELVGREVKVRFAHSTTYGYNGEKEIYCSDDYFRNCLIGTLQALLGFSSHFLSHLVVGPPAPKTPKIYNEVSRLRLIPLESQSVEGNVIYSSLLTGVQAEQPFSSFSFLSQWLYWEEQDLATLVSVPPARLGAFFHALQHSYGLCLRDGSDNRSENSAGSASLTSPELSVKPCPYKLGRNDATGILQQYLHRLVPKP